MKENSIRVTVYHLVLPRRNLHTKHEIKKDKRNGEVGRRLMHLVPAPAVRLMKRRVQSRPGVRQLETIPGKLHPNTGLESKISDSGNRKIDFGIAFLLFRLYFLLHVSRL